MARDVKPPYKANAGKMKPPPGTKNKLTKKGGNADSTDVLAMGASRRNAGTETRRKATPVAPMKKKAYPAKTKKK